MGYTSIFANELLVTPYPHIPAAVSLWDHRSVAGSAGGRGSDHEITGGFLRREAKKKS